MDFPIPPSSWWSTNTVFNRWYIDYNEDYRVRRDNILTLIGMKKITVFNRRYIDHNRDYKGGRKKY